MTEIKCVSVQHGVAGQKRHNSESDGPVSKKANTLNDTEGKLVFNRNI